MGDSVSFLPRMRFPKALSRKDLKIKTKGKGGVYVITIDVPKQ